MGTDEVSSDASTRRSECRPEVTDILRGLFLRANASPSSVRSRAPKQILFTYYRRILTEKPGVRK